MRALGTRSVTARASPLLAYQSAYIRGFHPFVHELCRGSDEFLHVHAYRRRLTETDGGARGWE